VMCDSIQSLPDLHVVETPSTDHDSSVVTAATDDDDGRETLPTDQRSCSVCYEEFQNSPPALVPRRLSCQHIVCTGCLEAEFGDGEVTCSECFQPTNCESIDALPSLKIKDDVMTNDDQSDRGGGGLSGSDPTSCPVCYTDFADMPRESAPRRLSCGHLMCSSCLIDSFGEPSDGGTHIVIPFFFFSFSSLSQFVIYNFIILCMECF
jgi:hypothetical protein